MRRPILISLLVTVTALAAVAAAPAAQDSAAARCKPGSTPAKIAGKQTCLKAGQVCQKKLDAQYHRYGLHCHSARLTRPKPAGGGTPPSSPPSAPPTPAPQLPGQKVDVGGYKLYLECAGSGSPTVIVEAGSGTGTATTNLPGWRAFRESLAGETRVCTYDRAGLGASDPRPSSIAQTGARYADELHALLAAANVPGPYVLVGASFGGLVVSAHVQRYPSDYVGLVFLDSDAPCSGQCRPDAAEPVLFDYTGLTFGSRPTVVLTAFYPDLGRELARLSTNKILADAPQADHNLPGSRPQLTLEAIKLVLTAVRSGSPLPGCAQTALPAAGGTCA
jgi:pimeloyl-ACP methyl ester carboxylesterase